MNATAPPPEDPVTKEACATLMELFADAASGKCHGEIGVFVNFKDGVPQYHRRYSDLKRQITRHQRS